jgi:hypothetical protein
MSDMSAENQIFLDGNGFKDETGSAILNFGLHFPTEKEADDALWFNPEEASKPLLYLLREKSGELTPALSRIALKSLTIPLFIREFKGPDVTDEIQESVNGIAFQNSVLLDAYLDRLSDESVDQTMLHQAINDSVVLQLVTRSFRSAEKDDIVLLPVSDEKYYKSPKINFTVLRRKKLGRAHLIVSEQTDAFYRQDVEGNQHRTRIKPSQLTGPDSTMVSLAEALIAEQQLDIINRNDFDLISAAAGKLFTLINTHFDEKEN